MTKVFMSSTECLKSMNFKQKNNFYLKIVSLPQINIFGQLSIQSHIQQMSRFFYDFDTLEKGTKLMVELLKETSEDINKPILPNVQPGFLRNKLSEEAPEEGKEVEYLMDMTKKIIFPGVMNWQSPRFFGYYPSSVNVTSVFAEMFVTTFQSPAFVYGVAPAFTELENLMVDWSAKALGLPEFFLLKNSGGGIINNSATESIFVSVHVAKFAKRKQLGIQGNDPNILKLVGYFGQGCHTSSLRGLFVKDIHYRRSVPYRFIAEKNNYEIDFQAFKQMVEEDIKAGLIPFWFGASWGNTFSAAIDLTFQIAKLCKQHKIWLHLDAAFIGPTWICEKYRPPEGLLQYLDSIDINFTKLLLNGTGGSLFYLRDKRIITQSFTGQMAQFNFYKNQYNQNYDIIDYKDWIVGLGRRNNSLKLYYTFVHYGLKKIRESVLEQEEKTEYLLKLINEHSSLFSLHTSYYVVITFQVKDKEGNASNALTKEAALAIKNIQEGFCTPTQFKGTYVIRIVIGNFHTTNEDLSKYFAKIVEASLKVQQKQ